MHGRLPKLISNMQWRRLVMTDSARGHLFPALSSHTEVRLRKGRFICKSFFRQYKQNRAFQDMWSRGTEGHG